MSAKTEAIRAAIARERKAVERKTAEIIAHNEMISFYEEQLNPPAPEKVK